MRRPIDLDDGHGVRHKEVGGILVISDFVLLLDFGVDLLHDGSHLFLIQALVEELVLPRLLQRFTVLNLGFVTTKKLLNIALLNFDAQLVYEVKDLSDHPQVNEAELLNLFLP